MSREVPSGSLHDLARISPAVLQPAEDEVDKYPPEWLIPDLSPITVFVTRDWLNGHGITHNCKGAILWSVVMTAKPVYRPKSGYVYFISNPETGKIKIGFSDDPDRRLSEGKTWCPRIELLRTIRVADMAAEEAYYHKRFGSSRFDGEWFLPDKDLVEFIANVESTTCGLMSGVYGEA